MAWEKTKLTRVFERAEAVIYFVTAGLLTLAAALLIVTAIGEAAVKLSNSSFVPALLLVLDRSLLVMMLAEVIYTVRRVAEKKRLDATPFLLIGIIAAVRKILVITAESAQHVDITDTKFQAALVELGLLALIIVALAGSMRLMPTADAEAPRDGEALAREDGGEKR